MGGPTVLTVADSALGAEGEGAAVDSVPLTVAVSLWRVVW